MKNCNNITRYQEEKQKIEFQKTWIGRWKNKFAKAKEKQLYLKWSQLLK